MNKQDLQEIQEITGLVSEKENKSVRKSAIVEDTEDLQYMVGLFVKVGKNYGLIDAVHGSRLGFIWSDATSWTGELVDLGECEVLNTKADIDKAMASAKGYLEREHASISARMAHKYQFDNQQVLANHLWHIEQWQEKLSKAA